MKKETAPNRAVTIKNTEVTLEETNTLATDVKESAYEDVTTKHSVSLACIDVRNKVPLYANVTESNFSSDGYMVAHNVAEDIKPHVYTTLMKKN